MPSSIAIAAFVLGAVLLLIAVLGGQFKIYAAEVSGSVGGRVRILAGVLGAFFIVVGLLGNPFGSTTTGPTPIPPTAITPGSPALSASAGGVTLSLTNVSVAKKAGQGRTLRFTFSVKNESGGGVQLPLDTFSAKDNSGKAYLADASLPDWPGVFNGGQTTTGSVTLKDSVPNTVTVLSVSFKLATGEDLTIDNVKVP